MAKSSIPEHPFWEFSLRFYQQPGVEGICLKLQDKYGYNVNMVLLCCWMAHSHRGALSLQDIADLHHRIDDWHGHITGPLRSLRRGVPAHPLQQQIKSLCLETELFAERIEQTLLFEQLDKPIQTPMAPSQKLNALCQSFSHYTQHLQKPMSSPLKSLFCQLLHAQCKAIKLNEIKVFCQKRLKGISKLPVAEEFQLR